MGPAGKVALCLGLMLLIVAWGPTIVGYICRKANYYDGWVRGMLARIRWEKEHERRMQASFEELARDAETVRSTVCASRSLRTPRLRSVAFHYFTLPGYSFNASLYPEGTLEKR